MSTTLTPPTTLPAVAPTPHPLISPAPTRPDPNRRPNLPSPEVRALLVRAVEYLDEHGWYRGGLYRNPHVPGERIFGPACILGTMLAVHDPVWHGEENAEQFQRGTLGKAVTHVGRTLGHGYGGGMLDRLVTYNDSAWRRKDEIRALLVKAIG